MLTVALANFRISGRLLAGSLEFDVPSGSAHLLKGPNGVGKSLLLDSLCGLIKGAGVRAYVGCQSLQGMTSFRRHNLGMRRMFQNPQLPPDVAVADLVSTMICRRGGKLSPAAYGLITESGLEGALTGRTPAFCGNVSFGQKRILEAIVAVQTGNILLLDEPFSGLSSGSGAALDRFVADEIKNGKCALIVDHYASEHTDLYSKIHEWPPIPYNGTGVARSEKVRIELVDAFFAAARERRSDTRFYWDIGTIRIEDRILVERSEILLGAGTLLVVQGANGAGKSTLLREIAGQGAERAYVRSTLSYNRRQREFFSPQPPKLVFRISVAENLALMTGGLSESRSGKEVILAMLEILHVASPKINAPSEVLSGGESSAVALVGALLSGNQLLILDEPFEGLSPTARVGAWSLIRSAMWAGQSFVLSVHGEDVLKFTSDAARMAITRDGCLTGKFEGASLAACRLGTL